MSQSTVATTVARRAPASRQRASLQVVTPTDRAGSVWFPVVCVALLLAGLAAVLGFNTSMAQDSFKVSALESRSATLADNEDALAQSINSKAAPQRLAVRADELGMVPASSAAFIDIDKDKVLGVAEVSKASDGFNVGGAATSTADEPSASAKAKADKAKADKAKSPTKSKADKAKSPTKSKADKAKSPTKSKAAKKNSSAKN